LSWTGPGVDDRRVTAEQIGRLVLAATPIGDADDASPRLTRLLGSADVVAAEDTRRLRRLTTALGVTPLGRVTSFHEHNESARAAELVEAMQAGATVLLVTDAGMPSVSDPGLVLVRAAIAAGVPVSAVPGPSAVLTALAVCGLPTDRFCFEGFLSRRAGERQRAIGALAQERRTMVFFEAPHRLAASLIDLAAVFGADRRAAVCRELTKTYEEVRRDSLGGLAGWAGDGQMRGEITVVVAGRPEPVEPTGEALATLVAQVQARVVGGMRVKDAVADVAPGTGIAKRALYDAVIAAKRA
jgi:16S rRNA (cytidine1402-2'-O)-methyltransferase